MKKDDNEYPKQTLSLYRRNLKRNGNKERKRKERFLKKQFCEKDNIISRLRQENEDLKKKLVEQEKLIEILNQKIEKMEEPNYLEFFESLDSKNTFKHLLNLEPQSFYEICDTIEIHYKSLNKYGIVRKIQYNKEIIPIKYALMITLFWLKHYPVDKVMNFLFGLHPIDIKRIIKKICICILKFYDHLVSWPSNEVFQNLKVFFFD